MKRKITLSAVAALVLICLALAACIVESERPAIRGPWIVNHNPEAPNYGQPIVGVIPIPARGYMGGDIAVNLYLDGTGRIAHVWFNLESETQSHVAPLPGAIIPVIILTNSFNFPNAIVSGATATARILTEAVRTEFIERGVAPDTIGF